MDRYEKESIVRGHVQTIFGKINVIMTLRGGGEGLPVTLTFVCVAFFLLTITPRFFCNYANYIARVILLWNGPFTRC